MQIELSPAEASYLAEAVKNGYFQNEEEAVKTALHILMEQTEASKRKLLDALAEGDADIEAGRVVDYTPSFMNDVMAEARILVKSSNKTVYDTNVIP